MKKLFFQVSIGPCLLLTTLLYRFLYTTLDLWIDACITTLIGFVLFKNPPLKRSKWLIEILGGFSGYLLKEHLLLGLSFGLSLWITYQSAKFFQVFYQEKRHSQDRLNVLDKLLETSLEQNRQLKEQLEALYNEPVDLHQDKESVELDPYCRSIQEAIAFENHLEQLEKEVQKKEQKRPLRRLQKMVMKQTSFFDEA